MKLGIRWFKSGAPWIWLTGGAVSVSMLSVLGLLLLIGWKGLSYFWPAQLTMWTTHDGTQIVGQLYADEKVPVSYLQEMLPDVPDQIQDNTLIRRLSIKVANRELYSSDFVSFLETDVAQTSVPDDWAVIERSRNGDFFGLPVGYRQANGKVIDSPLEELPKGLVYAQNLRDEINRILETEIRLISRSMDKLKLEHRKRELNGNLSEVYLETYRARHQTLMVQLRVAEQQLDGLRELLDREALIVEDMLGSRTEIPLSQIYDIWFPNQMTIGEKITHWFGEVWKFLSENPRESNSEGGVFPAIFGTVLLVLIMAIVVTPLGVIAAIYLHEYAENNWLTRLTRVAVINLAGVPSIVYGVFGLGFFVYTLGGSIDSLFYSERLPAPTFGTPGLLWSSLTLAILTLPVVIVATEEGLSRIPKSVRDGSFALGATQSETLMRIVLPMATPAMITGLILAVARAAGEVAPLMLVGVVKLASSLPVDGEFPFLHLDRKFMHLGFHIYDLGFQTSNIEAARPLVFATAFLLVLVIVALNLTAISIRNNLREKYRTLGQD
ncbi:phosphate ABC transporter permease PstA [Vibrio astriarenae]|uniref:Phosphate transport system permease protein PstA n=1 Tax=Vibrio astriarenae TaxID=1481923 RepID=A0A7Z2T1P2_9VIBR|nr:phosphate ABC transporter permease PstA [Vibrio astriarenae]QIA62617.1 phosphate ABC transporter permease PstA [Vibrio astriarenae]